ncbi:hypothetical protein Pfo_029486, partial [Paulownia fortunei]
IMVSTNNDLHASQPSQRNYLLDMEIKPQLQKTTRYLALEDVIIHILKHSRESLEYDCFTCTLFKTNKIKCKYHYPLSYCKSTIQGKDVYPIYKKNKNGLTISLKYLYIYIYIYKEHDRMAIHLTHNDDENLIDEIKYFQDARWVFAQEVMWRIFKFKLNEIYPTVIILQLHLSNQQFRINTKYRIEGEMYYLRLLLKYIRGGLLESDLSIVEYLNKAVTFQMPHELQRLFAIILVYGAPMDVRILWNSNFEAMSEDLKRESENSVELQVAKTLKTLNFFLESMGKKHHLNFFLESLAKRTTSCEPPNISIDLENMGNDFSSEMQDKMSIEITSEDYEIELKLNSEQYKTFSIILDCIQKGNEKTSLHRALLTHLITKNQIALATMTSIVTTSIMSMGDGAAELFCKEELNLWEESPMANFVEKLVDFAGDFWQILLVVIRAIIYQTISASLLKSYLWPKMILSLYKNAHLTHYMTSRAILTLISMFPREVKTFNIFDEPIDNTNNYYEEDFLNSLTPNRLSSHKLCNGRKIVCREFKSNVINAKIVFEQHSGNVFIPIIQFSQGENEGYYFPSQKQIISNIAVYYFIQVFSHDQLYISFVQFHEIFFTYICTRVFLQKNCLREKYEDLILQY